MVRKSCKLFRRLLAVGLILGLSVSPALASNVSARINSSKAKVFTSATHSIPLPAGAAVKVKAVKNGWAKVSTKKSEGFVRTKYLTAKDGITGYVKKRAYVYKSASKSSKKYGPLSVGTKLKVVGENGKFYQVTNGKAYGYIAKSAMSKKKPSKTAVLGSKVQLVKWSVGTKLFSRGQYVKLYDIQSGLTVRVRRLGGTNHAELEPATAKDTEKLLKMGGGKFSWASRPVILCVGKRRIAAAINTMPHGEQSITNNNFDGQFCLHLPGSKTHGTDTVNADHQAAIQYAYKWAKTRS